MEVMLKELPLLGYADLVDRWVEGDMELKELYAAKMNGRLKDLRSRLDDPPLAEVFDRARHYVSGRRVQDGLKHLSRMAPNNARLSWMRSRKNLQRILDEMVREGYKPNSVKRSLYRAIAEVLDHELGKRAREEIMFEVKPPSEDDSRDVHLTRDEIARLAEELDGEYRLAFLFAVMTGVDLGPMLRMKVKDFDPERGVYRVRDSKTKARPRTLVCSDMVFVVLSAAAGLKKEDDPVFSVSNSSLRVRWVRAREAAGLPDLRWKDLRHVAGQYLVEAGFGLRELGPIFGHSNLSTTLRYTSSQSTGDADRMNRAVEKMGIKEVVFELKAREVRNGDPEQGVE